MKTASKIAASIGKATWRWFCRLRWKHKIVAVVLAAVIVPTALQDILLAIMALGMMAGRLLLPVGVVAFAVHVAWKQRAIIHQAFSKVLMAATSAWDKFQAEMSKTLAGGQAEK